MYIPIMTGLDRIIIKMAIADARRRMREGCLPDQAVVKATPGAWQEYRGDVLGALLKEAAATGPDGHGEAGAVRSRAGSFWNQAGEAEMPDIRRDLSDSG